MPGQFHFSVDEVAREAEEAARPRHPGGDPVRRPRAGRTRSAARPGATKAWCSRRIRAHQEGGARPGRDRPTPASASTRPRPLRRPRSTASSTTTPRLENLARTALSYARAGVDLVAPSGMLDGFVGACRESLDEEGFDQVGIMAYSAKYASAYYGPFRDAVDIAPAVGRPRAATRWTRPTRARRSARSRSTSPRAPTSSWSSRRWPTSTSSRAVADEVDLPLAAYNVSGEYAMLKAAAEKGWIDYDRGDAGDAHRRSAAPAPTSSSPTTPRKRRGSWGDAETGTSQGFSSSTASS